MYISDDWIAFSGEGAILTMWNVYPSTFAVVFGAPSGCGLYAPLTLKSSKSWKFVCANAVAPVPDTGG